MRKLKTVNCEEIITQSIEPKEFETLPSGDGSDSKSTPLNFTDLPAPDFEKVFCNNDLSGDGNYWGDSRN